MTSIGHGSTQTQSQSALTYLEYTATLLPNVLIFYIGRRSGSSSNVSLTNMTQIQVFDTKLFIWSTKVMYTINIISENNSS
ncbi:hypothetical protein F8M41_011373 [Gigaspora margarita]|uniref:Uncharacterized protein n=1 Tax=Gigaspora margarita TaxID=4874 RepID=A0A8H3WZ81_GIGMA|nr:hypothetical protein F8M41_011373 [Gigaspora margarita]